MGGEETYLSIPLKRGSMQRLTSKVTHAWLNVQVIEREIRVNGAKDDLDLGEGPGNGVKAGVGSQKGHEDDVFLKKGNVKY